MISLRNVCTLYVSKNAGSDDNNGFYLTATAEGNGPVKTLEKAIAIVSDMRKQGYDHPVSVKITDEVYMVDKPVVIDETAFGVTVEPYTQTEIRGGVEIRDFKPDVFNNVNCYSADVSHLESLNFSDFYIGGKAAKVTRYPQTGTLSPQEVEVQDLELYKSSKWFIAKDEDFEVIKNFRNMEDAYISYYHHWIDEHSPIEAFDPQTKKITMTYLSRFSVSTATPAFNMEYVIENVGEMFSQPGQWYCDKQAKKLYYIPENEEEAQDLVGFVPVTDKLLIIKGTKEKKAAHVYIRGFSFRYTKGEYKSVGEKEICTHPCRDDGFASDIQSVCHAHGSIEFEYAYGCALEHCDLCCLGVHAINIQDGCAKIAIVGNRMTQIGGGGVYACGGAYGSDAATHTYGLTITDNTIHHGGRRYYAACGVLLRHVYECTVAHNDIAYLYYTGVSCGWVWGFGDSICHDNIIEKNHIHHLGGGPLSDMGGVYTLGRQPGTLVRGNVIHDIISKHYGGWALYTDEGSSCITLENNICYRISDNVYHHHYGHRNTVRNNIFAFCRESVFRLTRSTEQSGLLCEKNIFVLDGTPPFSVTIDNEYALASIQSSGNFLFDLNGKYDGVYVTVGDKKFTYADARDTVGMESDSVFVDPQFKDIAQDDFTLCDTSPALQMGFKQIDCTDVGPRE